MIKSTQAHSHAIHGLTRRGFVKFVAKMMVGGCAAIRLLDWGGPETSVAQEADHLVVRVHDTNATFWDYATGYYWDHVNQAVVDDMVDRAVCELTGCADINDAWHDVMSDYSAGDRVAVKINCNGNWTGSTPNHIIDACVEPIIAVLRGLVNIGIPQSDIYIYDAVRTLHERYPTRIHAVFPSVHVIGMESVSFGRTGDPYERIVLQRPIAESLYLADILINCQHLINMPLLKSHGPGVTGALKNHVGSQSVHSDLGLPDPTPIHHNMYTTSLADLNNNPHIRDKTRLIVADGLFGNWSFVVIDNGIMVGHPWITFGNAAANSIFASRDPVAVDSVMYDIIKAETDARGIDLDDGYYLHEAEALGLGIHEHTPYRRIRYREIESSATARGRVDEAIADFGEGAASRQDVETMIEEYQQSSL